MNILGCILSRIFTKLDMIDESSWVSDHMLLNGVTVWWSQVFRYFDFFFINWSYTHAKPAEGFAPLATALVWKCVQFQVKLTNLTTNWIIVKCNQFGKVILLILRLVWSWMTFMEMIFSCLVLLLPNLKWREIRLFIICDLLNMLLGCPMTLIRCLNSIYR